VEVDGHSASRPALMVADRSVLRLACGPADYVSRGRLKLQAALDQLALEATGLMALDIGASTGGFTEALLGAGAVRVYAVENGTGQLHPRLATDSRVLSLESTDARTLDRALVPEPVGAIVADVSFISLIKVLPASLALAAPGCWLAALVKPQFEGEPGTIPQDGVVKDPVLRAAAVERVSAWVAAQSGWRVVGTIPSPIHGGDGNVEYLLGARRDA